MASFLSSLLSRAVDPDVERAVDAAPNRVNEFGFDPWGFSPSFAKVGYTFGKSFFLRWFRPEVAGIENVPEGRVLLVPNHSGQLPFDGIVIALCMLLYGQPPRALRAMVERAFPSMPFVNEVLMRGGAVLGDPVNCRNLLEDEQAIVAPPALSTVGFVYTTGRFERALLKLSAMPEPAVADRPTIVAH